MQKYTNVLFEEEIGLQTSLCSDTVYGNQFDFLYRFFGGVGGGNVMGQFCRTYFVRPAFIKASVI